MTTEFIDIAAHDALFESRMSPEEWARISAFRNRPFFLASVHRHAGVMQPFFAHNLILNKVVAEVWRFQMLVFTLWLDAVYTPDNPHSGLTVANLQRVCTKMKLASPGRVFAFLNIMKLAGYVANAPPGADRRVARLMPTPSFLETVEEWNRNIWAAIDAGHPEGRLEAAGAAHPALGHQMRTSGAQGMIDGWDAVGPFPEVFHFAASDGGWLLMELVASQAITPDLRLAAAPVTLNMKSCAKQFGGSRTNLIKLLDSAYDLGLLEAPSKAGRGVAFSPRMTCAFITFLASFLGYFEMHTKAALAKFE